MFAVELYYARFWTMDVTTVAGQYGTNPIRRSVSPRVRRTRRQHPTFFDAL